MVSLEQVKLLESKVIKAVDYVKKVTDENKTLKGKLDSYQKRIEELEVLVRQFKEEQSRIEDGILSALDRLNQFEDAVEKALAVEKAPSAEKAPPVEKTPPVEKPAAPPPKEEALEKKEAKTSDPILMPESEALLAPAKSDDQKSKQELDIF